MNLAFGLFGLSLFLAPLAFGAMEPWAFFFLVLLVGAALVAYLVDCLRRSQPFWQVPGRWPLGLFGLFLLLQWLPLPEFLLNLLSPESQAVWAKSADVLQAGENRRISMDLAGGLNTGARFLLFCGFYFLSVQILSRRHGLWMKRTVLALVAFGGLLALFALVQSIFTVDRVMWFRYVPDNAMTFGPYVCHNHYAGLMEMLIPLALVLFWRARPARQYGSLREKLLGYSEDKGLPQYLLLGTAALLMIVSVVASLSRGGMISLGVALVFLVLMRPLFYRTSGARLKGRGQGVLLLAVVLIAGAWFGWDRLDQRFGEIPLSSEGVSQYSRVRFWADTLDIWSAFPLTGSGLGSFETVFPAYQSFVAKVTVGHAHNDYLELLAEGGLAGLLLWGVFFGVLFTGAVVRLKKRREKYPLSVAAAAGAGLAAIFCHSLVDFNLHINANALYFTFLCALLVAAANTRFRAHLPETNLPACGRAQVWLTLAVVLVGWSGLLLFSGGQWLADLAVRPVAQKSGTLPPGLPAASYDRIGRTAAVASARAPWAPLYWTMQGDAALFSQKPEKAIGFYQKALWRRPLSAEAVQKTGLALAYAGGPAEKSDRLLRAGIDFAPSEPGVYRPYAAWLLATGGHQTGLKIITRGIAVAPDDSEAFFELMAGAEYSPAAMQLVLPDEVPAYLRLAAYVRSGPYAAMRQGLLQRAVELALQAESPTHQSFCQLARLYQRLEKTDAAITTLEKGLGRLPDNPCLMYELARAYEQNQIVFQARQIYRRLLLRHPGYRDAAERLAALPAF